MLCKIMYLKKKCWADLRVKRWSDFFYDLELSFSSFLDVKTTVKQTNVSMTQTFCLLLWETHEVFLTSQSYLIPSVNTQVLFYLFTLYCKALHKATFTAPSAMHGQVTTFNEKSIYLYTH